MFNYPFSNFQPYTACHFRTNPLTIHKQLIYIAQNGLIISYCIFLQMQLEFCTCSKTQAMHFQRSHRNESEVRLCVCVCVFDSPSSLGAKLCFSVTRAAFGCESWKAVFLQVCGTVLMLLFIL